MTKKDKKADFGEKMIEVKVRFWTNKIAPKKGNIVPKHAWTSGMVRMERNFAHGIMPQKPKPFHSLMDITAVIEKVLIAHGVELHPSRVSKKYLSDREPSR